MAQPTVENKNITIKEFGSLTNQYNQDFDALFRQVNDAIADLFDEAIEEGWTPDKLIMEIDDLLSQ